MSDASTVDWETDIDDDDDSHCPSTLDKASTSDDGEDADFDVIDPSKDSTTTIILPQPEMVFELPETLKRNALTTNQDSSPGHTAIEASVANNGPECARSVNTAGSTAAESFVPVQALSRLNVGDSAQSSLCSNYTSNNSSVSQDQIRIDSKIANSSRWKHRGEEDDDTWASESWTRVGDADSDVTSLVTFTTTEGPSNSAVDDDASSLISDFDIISLSGASKRRCKMCTYINRDQDCLCQGCGRALLANPCVEVDEQIAKHLQMQEEDLAFKTVLLKEKKRSNISMQPLLVQSQLLSDDITDYVQTCLTDNRDTLSSNAVGLCANPSGSLNVIMSNFIEYVLACKRDASSSCPCKVSVAFHFSRTSESGTSTIRHHGFAASSPFSENANVALIDGSQANRPTMARRSAIALTAIPENEVVVDSSESNYLGWIAAIATGEGSKKQFGKGECSEGGKDAAVVTTLNNNYSVPLLCFDASLRNHKIIQRLRRGLDQLCNDFFLRGKECVDDIEKDTSHQCKRLKSGGQESVDKSCSASGFIRPVPCLSGWGEDVVQLGEYDKATEYNMAAMKDCLDELQGSCAGQGNEQITTKDGQKGGAEKSSEVTSNQDNPTVITDEKGVLSLECTDEGLARHLQDGLNEYKDREDLALDLAIYESFYIGSILEDPRDVAGSPTHSVGQAPDILECNEPEGYIGFLTKHED